METGIKCKHCGSSNLNKSGIEKQWDNRYQRYYCRDCFRISVYKIVNIVETNNKGVKDKWQK